MDGNSKSEETTPKESATEFKKPVLIGRIGKLPKKAKTVADKSSAESKTTKSNVKVSESDAAKNSLPPAVLLKELSTPIPYKEPKWSGLCPDGKLNCIHKQFNKYYSHNNLKG
jgi:hypothetical protein